MLPAAIPKRVARHLSTTNDRTEVASESNRMYAYQSEAVFHCAAGLSTLTRSPTPSSISPLLSALQRTPIPSHIMSISRASKAPWTPREIAFIIGFADYCIHRNLKYQNTVVAELHKFSPRTLSYNTIANKLYRVLKTYGITKVSMLELRDQGTGRIDFTLIPSDVRTELDGWRETWGLPPLGTKVTLADPSSLEGPGDGSGLDGDIVSAHPDGLCKSLTTPRTTSALESNPDPRRTQVSRLRRSKLKRHRSLTSMYRSAP